MPTKYEIRTERRGELLVVTVRELVNLAALSAIRQHVVKVFLKDEARAIVVDFRAATPVLNRADWAMLCAGSALPVLPTTVPVVFIAPIAFSTMTNAYVGYLRTLGLVRFNFSTPEAAFRVAASLRNYWPAAPCPRAVWVAIGARCAPADTPQCQCKRCSAPLVEASQSGQ